MSTDAVTEHYDRPELLAAIDEALVTSGIDPDAVTVEQLAPVDEFHIGGRPATERLFDQLGISADDHVLDIGCGIGGAARLAAGQAGRVTGVDLTPAYIETGNALNRRLGLDSRVELRVADAVALPFEDASFDVGYLLHVGMNIADKAALLAEAARVIRPGGRFGVYDVMLVGDGELSYPVPWATDPATSHLGTPDDYRQAAGAAGFRIDAESNRAEVAKAFFERLAAAAGSGPPPLGLQLLMGPTIAEKVPNMVAGVGGNVVAPVELILRR